MTPGQQAARLVEFGLQVVELYPGTNVAFRKNWPSKQFTPELAFDTWERWPQMNTGVVAWPNYWVLDLDGPAAIDWFLARFGDVDTLTILTPGRDGGRHLWFQRPDLEDGQELGQHLRGCRQAEIKHGPGRQTAWPPCPRVEGRYAFDHSKRSTPAPTPDDLIPYVVREERVSEPNGLSGLADLAEADGEWGDLGRVVLDAEYDHLVETMREQHEGSENRNKTLYWTARAAYDLGLDDLEDLKEAARGVGLDDDEIKGTVASALHASGHGE